MADRRVAETEKDVLNHHDVVYLSGSGIPGTDDSAKYTVSYMEEDQTGTSSLEA